MKSALAVILLFTSLLLFSQAGELDSSFGNQGKRVTEFEQISASATAIVTQSDGKILLVGNGESFDQTFDGVIVVRYLQDGRLDSNFADDGMLFYTGPELRISSSSVAVDESNNIFFTGSTFSDPQSVISRGYVVKLSSNGVVDDTFAQEGIWINETANTLGSYEEIFFQADGKILLAGSTLSFPEALKFAVTRLNPAGSLDDNYGINGTATITVPFDNIATCAGLNSNEEVIIGGNIFDDDASVIILTKFTNQGQADLTFGENGVVLDPSPLKEAAIDIAFQTDGKILLANRGSSVGPTDFGLARYNTDGTLDDDFGVNGRILTLFGKLRSNSYSVEVQEDGHILLSGFVGAPLNHNYAITRYDTFGNLDASFGNGGVVNTNLGFDDFIFTSTLQTDGKLLVAGESGGPDFSLFSIARLLTDIETSTNNIFEYINQIDISPNPNNGHFTLSFELDNSSITSIELLSANGSLLQQITFKDSFNMGKNSIDIKLNEIIPAGLYLVRIQTQHGVVNEKVVVER